MELIESALPPVAATATKAETPAPGASAIHNVSGGSESHPNAPFKEVMEAAVADLLGLRGLTGLEMVEAALAEVGDDAKKNSGDMSEAVLSALAALLTTNVMPAPVVVAEPAPAPDSGETAVAAVTGTVSQTPSAIQMQASDVPAASITPAETRDAAAESDQVPAPTVPVVSVGVAQPEAAQEVAVVETPRGDISTNLVSLPDGSATPALVPLPDGSTTPAPSPVQPDSQTTVQQTQVRAATTDNASPESVPAAQANAAQPKTPADSRSAPKLIIEESEVTPLKAENRPRAPASASPPKEAEPAAIGMVRTTPTADLVEPARLAEAHSPEIVTQIGRTIESLSRAGQPSLRLQLYPEALGRVELRVTHGADGLRVHLAADLAPTGLLIQQRLADLRQSLADSGLNIAAITVGLGHTSGQSAGPSEWQRPAAFWPAPDASARPSHEATQNEPEAAARTLFADTGTQVDYRI